MQKTLKVLYTNADQLPNKMEELKVMIMNREPDILVITEVIPKAQEHAITRAILKLPGYNEFFNFDPDVIIPRQCKKRGIAIYTKCGIVSQEHELTNLTEEHG